MTGFEVLSMIAGAGMVLSLVPAILLLREGTRPGRLLAAALLSAAANIFHALLFSPQGQGGGLLFEPLQFALPPLFAAYIRALFVPSWRLKPGDLGHFVPCVLMSIAALVFSSFHLQPPLPTLISLSCWGLLLIQAVLYIGRSLTRIRNYRRALKNELSNLSGIDPVWISRYSTGLHFLYLGYLVVPVILVHSGNLSLARAVISLVMCLAVAWLALHQLFSDRPPIITAVEMDSNPSSPLPGDQPGFDPELPAALLCAMAERHLYRNPNLDLSALSASLGWPRNQVSAAINGHFGCSFHDFINGYRVAEAQELMADPANSSLTILALGMQAGFNSKPTFNAVFKKTVGLTPSAWLAQVKSGQGRPKTAK